MIISFPRHSVNLSKESLYIIFKMLFTRNILKGEYENIFNKNFASYIGTKFTLGVSSARVALLVALKALGLKEGDEVIVSAYNFQIIPNILKEYGIRPIFVDIDPDTCNINVDLIENNISSRTKAIIATHMFGQPCDLDKIINICKKNNLLLIEDCAHACGSEYKGRKAGSFGTVGIFSFGFGKKMNCFGGGMFTANDNNIYMKARSIIDTFNYPSVSEIFKKIIKGILFYLFSRRILFSIFVYPLISLLDKLKINSLDRVLEKQDNFLTKAQIERKYYKFTNIQAAIGLIQLKKYEDVIKKTEKNVKIFIDSIVDIRNIKPLSNIKGVRNIYNYFMILSEDREGLRMSLLDKGVDTSIFGTIQDCSCLEYFEKEKTNCPVARITTQKIIEIPLSNHSLQPKDINILVRIFRDLNKR